MQKEGRKIILIVVVIALLINVVVASIPEIRGAVFIQYVTLGASLLCAVVVLILFRNRS